MAKEKDNTRVSVSKIQKILKDSVVEPEVIKYIVESETIEIVVKPYLGIGEFISFYKTILNNVLFEDGLHSEYMDFAERFAVIEHFSNAKLPVKTEDVYAVCYGTDLFENIKLCLSQSGLAQIDSAIQAVKNETEPYRTGNIYSLLEKNDDVADEIAGLVRWVQEKASTLIAQLENKIGDIDFKSEDMANVVKFLGKVREIDGQTIVSAAMQGVANMKLKEDEFATT